MAARFNMPVNNNSKVRIYLQSQPMEDPSNLLRNRRCQATTEERTSSTQGGVKSLKMTSLWAMDSRTRPPSRLCWISTLLNTKRNLTKRLSKPSKGEFRWHLWTQETSKAGCRAMRTTRDLSQQSITSSRLTSRPRSSEMGATWQGMGPRLRATGTMLQLWTKDYRRIGGATCQ